MYSEIVKIIEGGLKKDPKKVIGYSRILAEKLKKNGQENIAEKILKLISSSAVSNDNLVSLNELVTTPVDQESRLSIVDVFYPQEFNEKLVISEQIQSSLNAFIQSLNQRDRLLSHGIEVNSSLLLYGPPGFGKTTIAKYISYETKLPLVTARLDTIVSSLLGSTAKNIRRIFEFADSKPCILFLDEFDAIAKARDDQHETGELKRVINSLLQNIDHYTKNNILIAATNHEGLLDRAIWRRFENIIEIGKYKQDTYLERLVKLYSNDFKTDFLDDKKKLEAIVYQLKEYSPSDIKTIFHKAISKQVINNNDILTSEELLWVIFEFKNHGINDMNEFVRFLNENHIPQTSIANYINISLRQVKNIINTKS